MRLNESKTDYRQSMPPVGVSLCNNVLDKVGGRQNGAGITRELQNYRIDSRAIGEATSSLSVVESIVPPVAIQMTHMKFIGIYK